VRRSGGKSCRVACSWRRGGQTSGAGCTSCVTRSGSHLSMRGGGAEGDPGARRTCGPDDDPALHAPQSGGPRRGDRAAGSAVRRSKLWRYIGNGGPGPKMINESGGITGGEAGIRTLDRGLSPYNGLANRRLRPLGHLTATRKLSINEIATYAPADCPLDCPWQRADPGSESGDCAVRTGHQNAAVPFIDNHVGK
jgi:hypothetical protein